MDTDLFEKKNNLDQSSFTEKFTDVISNIGTSIFTLGSNKLKYYEPLIKSSLLNLKIHPETLDWTVSTYYNKDVKPTLTKIVTGSWLGSWIEDDSAVNSSLVDKFENKLTTADRFKIKLVNFIISNSRNMFTKDGVVNKDIQILAHASLINYYLYPDTLDYIMKIYNFKVRPTVIRHTIYENMFTILLVLGLLYSAFYVYKNKRTLRKKFKKSKILNKIKHRLSKIKNRLSRSNKRSNRKSRKKL
jgi:hypothetical protein